MLGFCSLVLPDQKMLSFKLVQCHMKANLKIKQIIILLSPNSLVMVSYKVNVYKLDFDMEADILEYRTIISDTLFILNSRIILDSLLNN